MKSGIVELYSYWGTLIEDASYESLKERNGIYRMWENLYGDRYRKGYIHVIPNIDSLATCKDGTNAGKKQTRNEEIISLKGRVNRMDIARKFNLSPNHLNKIYVNGK